MTLCVFNIYAKNLLNLKHANYTYCHTTNHPENVRRLHDTTISLSGSGENKVSPRTDCQMSSFTLRKYKNHESILIFVARNQTRLINNHY